jgi:hypothetical protein
MNQFKSLFKELFTEAETFQAKSKETGKLVNFKSKASMDAALKAGSHENPNAPKDGKAGGNDSKKDVPKVNIFDKPAASEPAADSMATVKSIAASTGLRATAVAGWADENGVNLSKVSDAIKSKKLKPMDFMTAVSGNPGNKYAKDVVAKYSNSSTKSEPTSQSKEEPKSSKPDRYGDSFEVGRPAVYKDGDKEYSGEVVMNPKNQTLVINGKSTFVGMGTVKGIQTYGSDTFIVPDNWNDVKSFDDSMEEPKSEPSQPKQQRKGNPQVNIAAKKAAEEAGITPQKLGGEYPDTMLKAAVEALTDSNYHDEARELIAKLEGKPEWAKKPEYPSMDDPQYNEKMRALKATGVDSSEYWDYDDNTGRFARKVSSESSWDGVDAADGIAFTLRMNGFHKQADAIQSIFDDKPYMKESGPLKLGKLIKESKKIKLKK